MSLVDLGKKLLEAARAGQDDEVRILMANGAPFTTDWVMKAFALFSKFCYFPYLKKKTGLLQISIYSAGLGSFLFEIMRSHHLMSTSKLNFVVSSYGLIFS